MTNIGPLGSVALNAATPRKVAYFYDDDIGYYAYPVGHPMKPHRIRLAHNLIMHYNLYRHMEVYVSAFSRKSSRESLVSGRSPCC